MPGTLFMRYWSRDCILLAQLTPFVKSLNFIKICTLRIIKSVPSFILVILCLSKFLSRLFTNILCHKTKNTVKTGIFTCWATWNRPNFNSSGQKSYGSKWDKISAYIGCRQWWALLDSAIRRRWRLWSQAELASPVP